jgi:hypothetical protein
MTFTISFTPLFTIYGLPDLNRVFSLVRRIDRRGEEGYVEIDTKLD